MGMDFIQYFDIILCNQYQLDFFKTFRERERERDREIMFLFKGFLTLLPEGIFPATRVYILRYSLGRV